MAEQQAHPRSISPSPPHPTETVKGSVGIFGGSFNPIHVGHIAIARQLLRATHLKEIWFMVSPQNPFKRNQRLLDDQKRLELAQKALAGEERLHVSDFEFSLPKPSFTLHTLQALVRAYPTKSFSLLIGGDNWAAFDRWFGYQEILRDYPIFVYPRQGTTIDTASLPPHVQAVDMPLLNVSSTEIRQRVHDHLPITGLVPETIEPLVAEYYKVLL